MSSKVFPSTGEKPKFNPNASFEAVDQEPVPKEKKPTFNPNAKFEGVNHELTVQNQPPQEEPQKFKSMTDWLNVQQGYQPLDKNNAIQLDAHTIKTGQASERVKEHLVDMDKSVANLIHDRKKDIQGRIVSEQLGLNPKEIGPINPQAQQLNSQLRQDIPVDQSEIDNFKAAMDRDHLLMRQGLAQKAKDLTNSDPIKAKQLKGDIYRLDRQNNPEKDSKIDENIKKINDGEYDYDIANGILTKPVGFFSGIVEGFKQKNQAFDDYSLYSSGTENDIIKHLNKKITGNPDDPTVIGSGGYANVVPGGEGGMMLGGQPIKPLAGGALAGWLGGPQAGTAAMSLISGPEMYKLGYASALPQNYAEIKRQNPNISDADAYHKASELADKQASVDAATGIAMGALGGEFAFKPTGLGANLLKKSVGSALKQVGEEGAKKALEGLGVGAIGGAGQLVKNIMSQKAGFKIDTGEGIPEQLNTGVYMTLGMTLAAKLPQLLNPKTYNQLFQAISNQPKEVIGAQLKSLEQTGHITPEESKSVQNAIQEHQSLDQSIKPDVPQADRIKVQELIKKRNDLEASLEIEDKAYHADTKEKIKALNDQINGISKGTTRGELQTLIDQEHKAGNIEGFVTETLRDVSEGDLKRYFKEIAEQAHDPNSETTTLATFGENIVNKAKELFPKEIDVNSLFDGTKSTEEIVSTLKNQVDDDFLNDQIEKLIPFLKENPEIKFSKMFSIGRGEAHLTGDWTVLLSHVKDKKQLIETIVHELYHSISVNKLLNDNAFDKNIEAIRMEAINKLGLQDYLKDAKNTDFGFTRDKKYYGLLDNKEFIAELFSNKGFNEMLDGIKTLEKNTILDKVATAIKKIIGIKESTYTEKIKQTILKGIDHKIEFENDPTIKEVVNNLKEAHRPSDFVYSEPQEPAVEYSGSKKSSISVIQPSEIKHPETITIKPEINAIPIGSTEAVHVGETPGDSQAMGGRISESGETASPQKAGINQEKGGDTGQEGVGEPPVIKPTGQGVHIEHPGTQLSFKGLQDTANEFGFEDVRSRDRKTDLQTRVNAERTANEWASKGEYQSNIDEMLSKIEKREMVPTDEQRLILEQYLENEKQKGREIPKNTPEYDRQLSKIKIIKEIGNIARSEAAAALRIPDGGSRNHPITDETDAMVAKMKANNVDKLTDQQKTEVEAQVEKYKNANDEANKKISELEEQVAKLDAQKEFNKAKFTIKRVKKTAAERVAFRRTEIDAAREALRKLRTGESGLSSVPLPGIRELMAIAPHVKNIMVDLVAHGVDNLQDVIKSLHTEFKDVLDGLTEKNIHDIIAGEYNEKGRPLSELQRQIRDLQDEAKLINQIEALENGVEPKTEKAKRERNQKIKALRDKIKELKATDGADELRAIKKRNEELTKKIKDKIAKGQFEKENKKSIFDREDVKQRHPELRKEALDAIAKKEEVQHEFDLALFNDEMKKRKWYQKVGNFGAKLIHTSKAIMSGIDDSATFVQNGLAILANPKIGAKAFLNHAKDAFSDARFKRELAALHSRPDWDVIKKSGLEIVEPHSAASKQVEEAFEQNLLAQLEIRGVKPWDYTGGIFERAFTSMGNNMRLLLFEQRMKSLDDAGMTFESHPKEYKDAARVINELTGRGKLPAGLAQASPYITPFIWAPRMLASTLNTLGIGEVMALKGKGYYQNLTPMQRKFALSQLAKGVGIGVAVMGAAALGGAKVDYDPRSVTFGDVILGDHHYNVFGRFTPVIKVLVQAGMGKRIKGGGEEQDLDSGKFGAKTRADVLYGFIRGKTTPAVGTTLNLMEGRNYFTNEKFTLKDVPGALLQPMSIKELRDGWNNDGSATILNRFLPAFEGMKTSDERDFNKKGGSGGGAGATGALKHKTIKHNKTHTSHKTH